MSSFYVYAHLRCDGRIFYIGKGQKRRAWSAACRNDHWRKVANKYAPHKVVILRDGLSEEAAFDLERRVIRIVGKVNLTNKTDGGDGVSGLRHSAEERERIKARRTGALHSAETRLKMSLAQKGRPSHSKGKPMSDRHKRAIAAGLSGVANPRADKTVYRFVHDEHGALEITRVELRKRFGLHNTSLARLVAGNAAHAQGWRVERPTD